MKIIFLDFDGVLNSDKYIKSCDRFGVIIDPARMIFLKEIVEKTDAKIVLSTSWREHWEKDSAECDGAGKQINEIFKEYGLEIFDKTLKSSFGREEEIKSWLDACPNVTEFVVLDDEFLCADFLNEHFVKTSNLRGGINEDDVKKAICILMNEKMEM